MSEIDVDEFIEARILTGMIVSTDYLRRLAPIWYEEYIRSIDVRIVADWIWDYYREYQSAPDAHIEDIYIQKRREGLDDDRAEIIELMLERASKDFGRAEQFNTAYLVDQTKAYFRQRRLEDHNEEVRELVREGRLDEAEKYASNYTELPDDLLRPGIYLDTDEALQKVREAFEEEAQLVVKYPGPFGSMVNDQLSRGAFVAFLAIEKAGKSFMLLDAAMRAMRQKANVAFFQAGDMTEGQQLRRIAAYLAKRPIKRLEDESNEPINAPVKDCIYNLADDCDLDERECDFGPFDGTEDPKELRKLTMEELIEAREKNPDYRPCHNCTAYERNHWGMVWPETKSARRPLDSVTAEKELSRFFRYYKNRFNLATYANGMLSVGDIRTALDLWERQDGWVADAIIVDYADLLVPDHKGDFRHQQNEIWKQLRGLSQERHCLLLTATQSDAKGYEASRLGMSNFSEDKRKFGHVTAMYGLNRDKDGREKGLGLVRVNEIVVREGHFETSREVNVMQELGLGRPFTGSFW